MTQKKNLNIIKFPTSIVEAERQVEAILFAAQEPLDVETIKSRLKFKCGQRKRAKTIWQIFLYAPNI